jgi:TorA maturation chaperone TorD
MSIEPGLVDAASAAGLLSAWWTDPTRDDFEAWLEPDWWADAAGLWARIGLASGLPERLSATLGASFEALSEEYQRLFVGPGKHPCPPYESVWRTDRPRIVQGTVLGPAATAVKVRYGEIGLQVRADAGELPDHIAIELEALAMSLGSPGAETTARALATEHLAIWTPAFCERTAAETTHGFFRALAVGTAEWIAGIASRIGTADAPGG